MKLFNVIGTRCFVVVSAALGVAVAAAQEQPVQGQQQKPPVLYKLEAVRRDATENRREADKFLEQVAADRQRLRNFGPINSSAREEELTALKQDLQQALQHVTAATKAWANSENELHNLQVETAREGILLIPERPEEAGPLGHRSLPRYEFGKSSTLELLKRSEPGIQADPEGRLPVLFDNNTREGGLVPVRIGTFLMATREEAQRAAHERKLQAEQFAREEKERKAREADALRIETARLAEIRRAEAEQRRRDAARRAEEDRRKRIEEYVVKLEAAINRHIENAANVDTSDPDAVQRYNDTTDYYIAEYKKYTGKDLTYKYKAAP